MSGSGGCDTSDSDSIVQEEELTLWRSANHLSSPRAWQQSDRMHSAHTVLAAAKSHWASNGHHHHPMPFEGTRSRNRSFLGMIESKSRLPRSTISRFPITDPAFSKQSETLSLYPRLHSGTRHKLGSGWLPAERNQPTTFAASPPRRTYRAGAFQVDGPNNRGRSSHTLPVF